MINDAYIKDISFYEASLSGNPPISDATHHIPEVKFIITEIETEEGITGQGYLLSFHYSPHAIYGALNDIALFLRTHPYAIFETVRFSKDYEAETEYFGREGIQKWATATVNLAMWDAWGKWNQQPVWKMLGGSYQSIPIYGSGGWLSYSIKELVEETRLYKKRGFGAVKIKVGGPEVEEDIERIAKVREELGSYINIMMDANQGLSLKRAIRLAREVERYNISWFEEPINHKNYAGYQTLRNKTSIPLAMGEREYNTEALKVLGSQNTLDLWQPDILRLGGVEGWKNSAVLAETFHVPVQPHYYKDYDISLLCTVPNGSGVESFDWIDGFIDRPVVIEKGFAFPRVEPGWGFSFIKGKLNVLKL